MAMTRVEEIIRFIEYDKDTHSVIEPDERQDSVLEELNGVIKTAKPKTIVKAGLGNGRVILDLARNTDSYLVVVEPSYVAIFNFLETNGSEEAVKKIHFICGDFHRFPIDYYGADLLICLDLFDIIDSGRVIDEFRRSLQFHGTLFLGLVILKDGDLEGIYDEVMHSVFGLHNDYYLEEDLKTFLDLNDFTYLKSTIKEFTIDFQNKIDYISEFQKEGENPPSPRVDEFNEDLKKFYGFEDDKLNEPYFIGSFKRRELE